MMLEPKAPVIQEKACANAEEFLALLSPTGELFGGKEGVGSYESKGDAWIFRGHSDDKYVLTPSALRSADSFARFGIPKIIDNKQQVESEIRTLERFFTLADATGLALPEDSQALRKELRRLRSDEYLSALEAGKEEWPPRALWSVLAIAQHYGIPTRLLDWSRNARTAAFFAAEGAALKLNALGERRERLVRDLRRI